MYDEAYLEETHLVHIKDYEYLIGEKEHRGPTKLRKIYFNSDINYLGGVKRDHENFDRYSINIKDFSDSRYVIERQSYREGTFYSKYTYLEKENCQRILEGDAGWMEKHSDVLLRDLFLQIQMNGLQAGVVVDYAREVYHMRYSSDMVIFDKSICSTYDFDVKDLLTENVKMKERLEEGYYVMTYRQPVIVPRVLASIFNYRDGHRLIPELSC